MEEILGDFTLGTLIGESLERLVLGALQHLWCELLAVQRVHQEILCVFFDFLLRALGLGCAPGLELCVGDVLEIGRNIWLRFRFDHLCCC